MPQKSGICEERRGKNDLSKKRQFHSVRVPRKMVADGINSIRRAVGKEAARL